MFSTQKYQNSKIPGSIKPALTVMGLAVLISIALAGCQNNEQTISQSSQFDRAIIEQYKQKQTSLEQIAKIDLERQPLEFDSKTDNNYCLRKPSEEAETYNTISTAQLKPSENLAPVYSVETRPELEELVNAQLAGNFQPNVEEVSVRMPLVEQENIADELVSVNFDQLDIRNVIKTIGDITGINFIMDKQIQGTVSMLSPTKIRAGQLFEVLESILDVHNYAAVPAGDFVKIIPKAEAARKNLKVRFGSDPSQIPVNDTIVTQIMPLKYMSTGEVTEIIKTMTTGSTINLVPLPKTNSIMITDTSANIHKIALLLQQLDVVGSRERSTLIHLEHASAEALCEQIIEIIENNSISNSANRTSSAINMMNPKVQPYTRTNSILIIANERDTQTIAELIAQLDVPTPSGVDKYHVRYLKNAQATEIVESLKIVLNDMRISDSINMSESAQISAEEGTNALIIIAGPQEYEIISGIIDKLDIFREQVLVEMKIIEVSEDALKEIGFDWATIDEAVTDSLRYFGGTNLGPRVEFQSGDLEGLAIGGWKHNGQSVQIAAIMKALEKNTGVNILSLPHIVTTNHKPAKVVVGENRPFVKDARITETTDFLTPTVIKNYEYRDVGITLEITPHINQNGLVTLVIQSEFTKLIEDVTTLSADTPVTAKRQVQTEVIMESDSTVVIGGLLRDDKVTTKKAVPIVSEIPIFGELFKSSKERVEKTNLLMLITPHIMTTQADLDDMAEKKQKEISLEN